MAVRVLNTNSQNLSLTCFIGSDYLTHHKARFHVVVCPCYGISCSTQKSNTAKHMIETSCTAKSRMQENPERNHKRQKAVGKS